ncbi:MULTISPECIES: helix-turn-helix domain-containing protein [unclassified Cryobacterium]|uniref:TetR/AcrR family transcriptional regulator n=1 Tax=unclassified Cryobacterium TaxID=2649013 RepID=UPI002B22FA61|nr:MULTISPECIES: helix-turn-helix domain-containing protein [unclassified Cryobacterium]MEB0001031.1 helix-turn-helix domain-containing protein [Cryobacterium sp. RTS3]MEB0267590.1 helix-turn-helix domain-containing protein [Cryobacterium sp. 10I5]
MDATTALSRLLGKQVAVVNDEVGVAIAAGLRDAARGLNDASENISNFRGPQAARGGQGRRERVDRTRADLLDAAAQVFSARGFEGASVGDVAAAAGYTKGAIYSHFGSKSKLFLSLARERVLCPGTHGDADDSGTPCQAADSQTDLIADGPDLFDETSSRFAASADDPETLLALEVLAYAVRHPEARPELADLFEVAIDGLATRVRDDRLRHESQEKENANTGHVSSVPPAPPTENDYDAALGVLAVANITSMLSTISPSPRLSAPAGLRVIAQLLHR